MMLNHVIAATNNQPPTFNQVGYWLLWTEYNRIDIAKGKIIPLKIPAF